MSSSEDSDNDDSFQIEEDEVGKISESSDSSSEDDMPSFGTGDRKRTVSDDDQEIHGPKKLKAQWVESYTYSEKAVNLMKKMGYQENKGLGKMGQGRLEPVQQSDQKGRRGLGLHLDSLSSAAVKWNKDMEVIQIPEEVKWIYNPDQQNEFLDRTSFEELANWVVYGPKKMTIDDETHFCDADILTNVLKSKSAFDQLEASDMRKARGRSNPFETIRGNIFQNRAAVKMANMDCMCDFMFTEPVDEAGACMVNENNLLYFADVCAGPGGFSEYILYKKKWRARGFGFTLRGGNDFKLENFYAGPPETFDPYYGVKDDGDIYDTANQESFQDYVLKQTQTGVHFVMADGGFSVEGENNIQEILSKQLYLCQCLVALSILREKGHFVCKLFDLFTPFSVGLVYLMFKCFEQITICKPNTSRPANSERYMICKWRKPNISIIHEHLKQVNVKLNEFKAKELDHDVVELVNLDILKDDKEFVDYISESNNKIGHNQIVGLIKIAAFSQSDELKEPNQDKIREQCLNLWKLPNAIRTTPEMKSTDLLAKELLKHYHDDKFLMCPRQLLLSTEDLTTNIKGLYEWYFYPIDRINTDMDSRTLYICKGKSNILKLNSKGKWQQVECNFEISPKTIFYGEIVTEFTGESKSQTKSTALHIIDAMFLGGKDIRAHPLRARLRECDRFARSLSKPFKMVHGPDGSQKLMSPIRCKRLYPIRDFENFFDKMRHYTLKDGQHRLGISIPQDNPDNRQERFYVPGGLLFYSEIYPVFSSHFSRSQKIPYYFNSRTNKTFFCDEFNEGSAAGAFKSFRANYCDKLYWEWTNIYQVAETVPHGQKNPNILYRTDITEFIKKFL